jgi:hypothetical protein
MEPVFNFLSNKWCIRAGWAVIDQKKDIRADVRV